MVSVSIEQSPTDYFGWVECLKKMKTGIPDTNTFAVLRKGTCPEYEGIKAGMHKLSEASVNAVIANCIKALKRDIARFSDANETVGIHIAFVRFGKRINGCMFFTEMHFLDQRFCDELRHETITQVTRFWSEMLNNIKKDSAARNNLRMAEELFIIKRVKLLDKYRISA